MIFREANLIDIPAIQVIRNSVRENMLSDPSLVTDEDCKEFITERGKGWVCEIENTIVGFAIADLENNNIWALFIHPYYEGKGIGQQLHDIMLDWYFSHTKVPLWLSTEFNTRAESVYRKAGWMPVGTHGEDEIKFEMRFDNWIKRFKPKK